MRSGKSFDLQSKRWDVLRPSAFLYQPESDGYSCPARRRLVRKQIMRETTVFFTPLWTADSTSQVGLVIWQVFKTSTCAARDRALDRVAWW
jgi:hypothetical protein